MGGTQRKLNFDVFLCCELPITADKSHSFTIISTPSEATTCFMYCYSMWREEGKEYSPSRTQHDRLHKSILINSASLNLPALLERLLSASGAMAR